MVIIICLRIQSNNHLNTGKGRIAAFFVLNSSGFEKNFAQY